MQQTQSLLPWNSEPNLRLKKANSNIHSVVFVQFLPNEVHRRYLSISVDWVDYKVQSFRTAYRASTYIKYSMYCIKKSTQRYL